MKNWYTCGYINRMSLRNTLCIRFKLTIKFFPISPLAMRFSIYAKQCPGLILIDATHTNGQHNSARLKCRMEGLSIDIWHCLYYVFYSFVSTSHRGFCCRHEWSSSTVEIFVVQVSSKNGIDRRFQSTRPLLHINQGMFRSVHFFHTVRTRFDRMEQHEILNCSNYKYVSVS